MLKHNIIFNIQVIQLIGFFIALLISYLLTPLIRTRAFKLGVLDKPDERKIHETPVPRLGGVSIYVSLFLTSLIFITIYWNYHVSLGGALSLLGIVAGGTVIFLLGLLDDIEPLPALLKLFIQVLAATVAWLLGVKIMSIINPLYHADFKIFEISTGNPSIQFSPLISYLITLLWIVGITNATNLIDGMDGLATGVSLISALAIWSVAVDFRINQPAVALMTATLAGGLLGFLRWNFNPARIFLGDSGAYLTGFVLAALAVSCATKKVALVTIAPVLILIFALPIVDTSFAIIRRTLSRKSILEPDTGHLHHRVLATGLSQKITSYLFYLVTAFFGFCATFLVSNKSILRFLFLSIITVLVALFYTFIINWKHQKMFRDVIARNGEAVTKQSQTD